MALLDELLEAACIAARIGGATLMHYRGRFEAREKGPADLVTDADHASQDAIQRQLAQLRPDDAFIGEESTGSQQPDKDQICWVVDPLDGTTNYVHGFPAYATSVAAVRGNELLVGAVFDPNRGELFAAAAGRGATLNGAKLTVSDSTQLSESLVAISLPATLAADSPDLDDLVSVIRTARAVRRTGSAALNLAYTACGRLDAHWAYQIMPWDSAAGALLVQEAGGVLTGRDGRDFDVWKGHYIVASTRALYDEVCACIRNLAAD